jgi:predicted aspartyl protease
VGLIVKKLVVAGSAGSAVEEVLFDTGTRSSAVRRDLACKLGSPEKLKTPPHFMAARRGVTMKSSEVMLVQIKIDGHFLNGQFYVLDDLRRPIIVGADFLQLWSIALFPKSHRIKVGFDFKEGFELF